MEFRSARKTRKRRAIAEINVVPYIDVMLVLLVIFMVTAPLLTQGVKIDLPHAAAQTLSDDTHPIIVSVDAEGRYYLNIDLHPEKPMDPNDLAVRVSAELQISGQKGETPPPVLIKGDAGVDYGSVVKAMVLLQEAGASSVGLMTDPEAASPSLMERLTPKGAG